MNVCVKFHSFTLKIMELCAQYLNFIIDQYTWPSIWIFASTIDKQFRYESKPFVLTNRINKKAAALNKSEAKKIVGKISLSVNVLL